MQNLDHTYYDKGRINDNELDYDFLHQREHYRPLIGHSKFRPFYLLPAYARRQDWEYSAGYKRYFFRAVVGLLFLGIGY